MLKLTKNDVRYNEAKFPVINSKVSFLPIDIINPAPHLITRKSKRTFIKSYMKEGAKCKVLGRTEHLTLCHFLDDKDKDNIDMVSNCCLVSQDLTKSALDAIDFLIRQRDEKQIA